MKRVCIFSAQYLPSTYGVEKYTYNIAREMSRRGIEVTIVTSDLYGAKAVEKEEQITVYRLPSYGLLNNRLPVIKYSRQFRKLIKKIAQENYDLCIIQTRFYPLSLVGALVGKKRAKRSIFIEHGTSHIEMGNIILKKIGEFYEHTITFLEKRKAEEFYGVSSDCNHWLTHFGITAKGVLYNAIQPGEIEDIPCCGMRERLRINKDHILIVFTGRLIVEKGALQLVNAFADLQKKYQNLSLVVAGDGPLMKELEEIKIDNLRLLGRVSFQEVISLLKEADIFCFPSVYAEGLPTSLLEAGICKNCLISTRCGGAGEIIAGEEYGILIEDNSIQRIKEALERVIEDRSYREMMADNVYHRIKENFIWSRIVDRIEEEFFKKE